MALFRKSKDEQRLQYIAFLRKLASQAELIVKYAEGTDSQEALTTLTEEIKYFIPIETTSIKQIDHKIANVLGDLKILTYTNRDPYRIQNKIEELESLINERNTKI